MVVVTDHAGNLPCAVLVLPQMNKLGLADSLCVVMSWMVKSVNAHLNRAIALHVIHLKAAWNEFTGHLAADIRLYAFGQLIFTECYSSLIVINLHIIGKKCGELHQIAAVVGVE